MQAQEHASFDAGTLENHPRPANAARAVIPPGGMDAPIRFVAQDGNAALAWRPYRLHIGTRLVLGRTDENGFTAQLTRLERESLTAWVIE